MVEDLARWEAEMDVWERTPLTESVDGWLTWVFSARTYSQRLREWVKAEPMPADQKIEIAGRVIPWLFRINERSRKMLVRWV